MLSSLYGDLPSASGAEAPQQSMFARPGAPPTPAASQGQARAKPAIDIAKIQADLAKLKGQQVKQEPGEAISSDAAKRLSADEEYDPAQPCDYDALCKDRIRKRAAEEMEKRRRIEEEMEKRRRI